MISSILAIGHQDLVSIRRNVKARKQERAGMANGTSSVQREKGSRPPTVVWADAIAEGKVKNYCKGTYVIVAFAFGCEIFGEITGRDVHDDEPVYQIRMDGTGELVEIPAWFVECAE